MKRKADIEALFQCMAESDRKGAVALTERLLDEGVPKVDVLNQVLNPTLVKIGALWSCEVISLSQTFVAAKIAEDILLRCRVDLPNGERASKGPVVLGNIEDDFHGLGRRIVGLFLTSTGWNVHDLGNDVPAEDFVDCAVEVNATVIGVSAMMQSTALGIRRVRTLIDERGLQHRVRLAVGGAVFAWRPELAGKVGADGTAANALEADPLFDRLKAEVLEGTREVS